MHTYIQDIIKTRGMAAYIADKSSPWECAGAQCGLAKGAVSKTYPYINTVSAGFVCMYMHVYV
jgi:hypothetical protein